jgi:hypothetical protein
MTLDQRFCGRTLREWAAMTEDQRKADPNVGEKKIKALNGKLAEALAVQGTADAAAAKPPAVTTVDVQKDQTTVVTHAPETAEPVAEAPAEASKPILPQPAPPNGRIEPPKEKSKREPKAKQKNDPRLIAAARELRDRWLEQVNAEPSLLVSAGKYDVARLPAAGAEPVAGAGNRLLAA